MAPHSLTFRGCFSYDNQLDGITLEVVISSGDNRERLAAKLDTGAAFCIFARDHGENLGLDIEGGERKEFSTATGSFTAYGHPVTIEALELRLEATAYFAADRSFSRNVLGRFGWLQQTRLGLIDYECKLFVSHYNDPG